MAATVVLIGMAAAWGSALTILKSVTEEVPIADFMAVRYCIAAIALTAVAPRAVFRLPAASVRRAMLLGLIWGVAQLIQISALRYTDASVSGFIAGLFVVVTPVLAWLVLRQRLEASTWLAVALALLGFGVLTFHGLSVQLGELVTGVSAILYALHIVGLSVWSRRDQVVGMSVVQIMVVAGLYVVAAGPNGIATPATVNDWLLLLYMALGITAGGLVAQMWAQGRLSPTRSAVILALEPAFTAASAILFRGERVTWHLAVGACLVVAAIAMSEIAPQWTERSAGRAPRAP